MNPGQVQRNAGRDGVGAHDVACSVYLARHSAYLDGELAAGERLAHERHQAGCASCARYARVLAGGVDVLRELPEIEPSADFEARLQHRLFHLQDDAALAPPRRSRAWLAAAAAVMVVVVGERLLDARAADEAAAAAAETEPLRRTATWGAAWESPVPSPAVSSPALLLHVQAYSPVVVQPPVYRPVSYGTAATD